MALREYITSIVPSWLSRTMGKAVLTGLGDEADGVASNALDALEYGRIEECASDGLSPHLRNSNLQVISGETASATRTFLRRRWTTWRESGGVEGMAAALARLGYPSIEIWTELDLRLAGVPNAFGGYQGFFFVFVKKPNPFTAAKDWGAGQKWKEGDLWGVGGVARATIDDLIFTIRKFKPATSSCRFLLLDLNGMAQLIPKWGTSTWGAFNWGLGFGGGTSVTIPVGEPWEVDPETGWRREFYHYSFTQERVS